MSVDEEHKILADKFRAELREQFDGTRWFTPFYMDVRLQDMMYHATYGWGGWRMFDE